MNTKKILCYIVISMVCQFINIETKYVSQSAPLYKEICAHFITNTISHETIVAFFDELITLEQPAIQCLLHDEQKKKTFNKHNFWALCCKKHFIKKYVRAQLAQVPAKNVQKKIAHLLQKTFDISTLHAHYASIVDACMTHPELLEWLQKLLTDYLDKAIIALPVAHKLIEQYRIPQEIGTLLLAEPTLIADAYTYLLHDCSQEQKTYALATLLTIICYCSENELVRLPAIHQPKINAISFKKYLMQKLYS